MPDRTQSLRLVRFDSFEFDLPSGELRQQGIPVRMQRQPSKVLAKLVSNPGKLVTREDLRHEVWDETTFVDFEHGLNFCIRQIRAVLGDNADTPRFIETVPRVGYRFIAGVEAVTSVPQQPEHAARTAANDVSRRTEARKHNRLQFVWGLPIWAAIAFLALVVSTVILDLRRATPMSAPGVVRIISITNDGEQKLTNTPYDFQSPMVSDGSRLFFEEQRSVHSAIAEVGLKGGEAEVLKTPFRSAQLAGISPDQLHLLVADMYTETATDIPFYNLSVTGGSAQRIGDFLAHDAAWSPSGEFLAVCRKDELDIANTGGEPVRKLVSGIGLLWWPRWSPNGKVLRFTVTDPKTQSNSIWEVASDGGKLRPVLDGWGTTPNECCGSWTPDGKYFVFQAIQDDADTIWALPEQATHFLARKPQQPVQLTSGPMLTYAPMPSTDGRSIYVIGAKRRSELVRYNSRHKNFEPVLTGLSASELEFSNDGHWITYIAYPQRTLWRARADGTERLQLTSAPMQAWLPRWSPDEKQIAFFGGMPGQPWKIYIVSSVGGQLRSVLAENFNQGDPSWSPDGHSLAFGRLPWKTGTTEPSAIYILNLQTGLVHVLPGSEGLFSPRWSPTGQYLMAMKPDSTAIRLFAFASRTWTTLATGLLNYASWSRDGKYVYAEDSHLPRISTVVRIQISNGKVGNVADLSNLRLISTGWMGIDPTEAPIVAREIGTEEIYALEWNTR